MGYESLTEEEAIRAFGKECNQLGAKLANMTAHETWPAETFGMPTARQFSAFIFKHVSGNNLAALREWIQRASACEDFSRHADIWGTCPGVLIGLFEETREQFAPTKADDDESDAMSPADLFERACSIVVNYVPWKSDEDELAAVESTLLMGSASQREAVIQWATDVIATNESGTDLLANDAPLLRSIPEPLRDFFDLASLDGKSTDDSLPPKPESLPDKPSRSREESMRKIMDRIPNAVAELNEAEGTVAGLEAEVKLARKNLESKHAMLIALNREYVRVRDGGEYQMPLPFNGSEDAATASPSGAAKSGTTPGNADEVAGWHVSVLTAKELLQKTNGQSEGAGITDANVDALVDAELGTIGLLESHMKKHGEHWFKSLKGIGEGKACKIAEALGCLRACYPVDTEPLEPLVLDEDAYHMGFNSRVEGHPCSIPNGWSATGMQGRSFVEGWKKGGA